MKSQLHPSLHGAVCGAGRCRQLEMRAGPRSPARPQPGPSPHAAGLGDLQVRSFPPVKICQRGQSRSKSPSAGIRSALWSWVVFPSLFFLLKCRSWGGTLGRLRLNRAVIRLGMHSLKQLPGCGNKTLQEPTCTKSLPGFLWHRRRCGATSSPGSCAQTQQPVARSSRAAGRLPGAPCPEGSPNPISTA